MPVSVIPSSCCECRYALSSFVRAQITMADAPGFLGLSSLGLGGAGLTTGGGGLGFFGSFFWADAATERQATTAQINSIFVKILIVSLPLSFINAWGKRESASA
jgi:hypothetical protein